MCGICRNIACEIIYFTHLYPQCIIFTPFFFVWKSTKINKCKAYVGSRLQVFVIMLTDYIKKESKQFKMGFRRKIRFSAKRQFKSTFCPRLRLHTKFALFSFRKYLQKTKLSCYIIIFPRTARNKDPLKVSWFQTTRN